jgi:MSHA pilin protein MshA
MVRTQKGFTLIELVMVIVILGILAAVAIPRYINLQTQAQQASLAGLTGAVQSSAAILMASSPFGPKTRAQVVAATVTSTGVNLGTAVANQISITLPDGTAGTVVMGSLTSD